MSSRKEMTQYTTDHKAHAANQPIPQLIVERGQINTYRLAEALIVLPKGKVFVDCGFRVWCPAKCALTRIPQDVLVQTLKSGASYKVVKSERAQQDLYTYKARLKRLIDADTLWAEIEVGFGAVTLQKLRLRGIDAPEVTTAAGRRARRFVEKLLKPCPFIIVKTYKDRTDKYDRYLVDVFFLPEGKDAQVVAAEGVCLNQRLLDEGLAKMYEG